MIGAAFRAPVGILLRGGALALLLGLGGAGASAQPLSRGQAVLLRGLDRVSGATTDLTIPVGGRGTYARLEIAVTDCRYPAGDPAAGGYAFLEITDTLRNERLFRGWMIATAPALNALDHPRHDIWVLGCQ